ncbi:MAG: GAF domain-containing protein [bacterium]|nr:GAF domain-containing protein [bacterium]
MAQPRALRPRSTRTLERSSVAATADEASQNTRAVLAVVEAIGRATTSDEAVQAALDTVRAAFGWAYGSYWALVPQEEALRFAAQSGTVTEEFQRVTQEARFREGEGLSGRAWRSRDLFFVQDLGDMRDCCRAPAAQRAGVKSGVCFPIVLRGQVVGTMDFFALETLSPSEERLDTLRAVGRLVSSAIERQQAAEEAARVHSMMENAPINVIFADRNGTIRYVNPKSRETLRAIEQHLPIKADEILGQSFDVFHRDPAHQRRIIADPKNLPHKAIIRVGPESLDLLVSPIFDAHGAYLGPMLTWQVVTEALAAQERERAFTTQLRTVVEKVTESSQAVAAASEELTASSQQMSSNAEETASQAQVVAAAAEQVSRNVQTVATATEEMTASIKEIAKNAGDAARVATSAVSVAESTNTKVAALGESSAEIGKVIKVITSIAQQTNLLALNATIEAARAGEAGKGFAVVANEVKELAKETAKATEEISQKIEAIQNDTRAAVEAIGEIGGVINQINDIQNTIASAVEEQTATTNEIGRNVAEAAKGSAEIAENISGVAGSAAATSAGAGDASRAAGELARLASDLREIVANAEV